MCNIPSKGQQNTDIGWNGLMLQCYTLMLHCYSYNLPIYTCSPVIKPGTQLRTECLECLRMVRVCLLIQLVCHLHGANTWRTCPGKRWMNIFWHGRTTCVWFANMNYTEKPVLHCTRTSHCVRTKDRQILLCDELFANHSKRFDSQVCTNLYITMWHYNVTLHV